MGHTGHICHHTARHRSSAHGEFRSGLYFRYWSPPATASESCESVSRHPSGAKDCCLSPQDSSTQIPKFGIVLVVVLVLGAWDSVTAKSAMSCN
jgi:hypothetical protein